MVTPSTFVHSELSLNEFTQISKDWSEPSL